MAENSFANLYYAENAYIKGLFLELRKLERGYLLCEVLLPFRVLHVFRQKTCLQTVPIKLTLLEIAVNPLR